MRAGEVICTQDQWTRLRMRDSLSHNLFLIAPQSQFQASSHPSKLFPILHFDLEARVCTYQLLEMSRSPSPSESGVYSVSTDSHPLQLETDEIPWSSSSSSSGGIPEFSTRALPFEPITDQQIALDYLHQFIPTLQPDQPLQSPSDPASQGHLEVARRGTADIIARYRLIMDANERLRNRRVAQSSHHWMYIWARIYGRPYAEAVDRRLRPFVNRITRQIRVSFEHLDQLCEETTAMVLAANSGQAIDAAFTRFFNEARDLDDARQRRMSVILQRARARMARLVQTGLPEWPRFVDAFFALDLDGGYSVGRAPADLGFLRQMNAWPGSRLAPWASIAILRDVLRRWQRPGL